MVYKLPDNYGKCMYIHEQKDWPEFTWNEAGVYPLLAEVRHAQGLLLGQMTSLGFNLKKEASLLVLTQDAVKTAEIEGEILNPASVRSSIARKLGFDDASPTPSDRDVDGLVEVLIDATNNYNQPLSEERLFGWHAALFPTGRSGMRRITVGDWRKDETGPMQVISGPLGSEKVHFQAPDHERLADDMTRLISWFNASCKLDPFIKAALSHFYFVTIHPFDDGNGRIARAIGDMQLARADKIDLRFYSMSVQIQKEKKSYYNTLERCQKGPLDVSVWIQWYLDRLLRAIHGSKSILRSILDKASFWQQHEDDKFNSRQKVMLNRLLDGFDGKLTSSKWAKITKCSQDTAQRDINDLIKKDILEKEDAGGRSTSYRICK
ncbi:Fic family protein [Verrucomicrobiota bacterium]